MGIFCEFTKRKPVDAFHKKVRNRAQNQLLLLTYQLISN